MDYLYGKTGVINSRKLNDRHFIIHLPEEYKNINKFKEDNSGIKDLPFHIVLWHYINNITVIPKCKNCGGSVKFRHFACGYDQYCSLKCVGIGTATDDKKNKFKNSREKRKEENKLVYNYFVPGTENYERAHKLTEFLDEAYIKITYAQRAWHIKNKTFEIYKCICGKPSIFKFHRYKTCSNECESKLHVLSTEKYYMENYGVKNSWQLESTKNKIRATNLTRYGIEISGASNHFNYKEYKLPSGRVIKVQGFENRGLDLLLTKYLEDDILYGPKEIHREIGMFKYNLAGKDHSYFPDFFIKSENKIVEVKSEWTYDRRGKSKILRKTNMLKKKSCLDRGFNFEFMIFS